MQTILVNFLKAYAIDWLMTKIKKNEIKDKLFDKNINISNIFNSYINKFRKSIINTDGLVELYVLSSIFPYPIIVYDNYDNIKYTFLDGVMNAKIKKSIENKIHIKFEYNASNRIPSKIYSIFFTSPNKKS